MADVSLGEILSVARDPGEGSVSPRAKIDMSDLVHTLNQNAQFKAENDWRKYSEFTNNLKGVYKELGEIQGLDVAQADRPMLQKKAADIFAKIGNDPKKFFSGGLADVEKEIGQLRSMSSQSVQDKVFDDAHRAYIERDPTLQTDENKSIIDGYFKQPLGQRKPYMLKLPSLYNPQAIAEQINAVIPQKFSTTGLSPDGRFINTTTGIRYDAKQFKTLADQMRLSVDPKTGRTIGDEAADRLKSLPPSVQQYYLERYPDDPAKGFYEETVMPWRKPDQIEKTESKDNPFELESMKELSKVGLENLRYRHEENLALLRANLEKKPPKEKTKFLLDTYSEMLNNTTGQKFTVESGKGKYSTEEVINATPEMLKLFSKGGKQTISEGGVTGSDKETITEVNDPDLLTRTSDGGIRAIFYRKYTRDDQKKNNKIRVGDPVRDRDGKPIQESVDVIPKRQAMAIIGNKFIDKKDIAGAVEMAGDVIDKQFGGDIYKYDGGEGGQAEKYPLPKGKPQTVTQNGFTYTWNTQTGKYE